MEMYLGNILTFCLIIFVIALTICVIQVILIFLDIRESVKEAKKLLKDLEKKIKAVTSVLDVAVMLVGGMDQIKNRVASQVIKKSNMGAFIAGLKKGAQVLFGGEK